jgi:hypothetical protein
MRGKKSPFFTQMKPPLSTQNYNLADAWKPQVDNKGEHMGSCFQECEASEAEGALEENKCYAQWRDLELSCSAC